MKAFYSQFLQPGDLCFDVGSNLGNRLEVFRSLGCRVVAVEPQSACFMELQSRFGTDADVVLLRTALGEQEGEMEIRLSEANTIASMSPEWIRSVRESGRFAEFHWDRSEVVKVTTLDALIARHGVPRFIKIDVEGFEQEVLRGLSQPVPSLSFEWTPEFSAAMIVCLDHLETLGKIDVTYSLGESMSIAKEGWQTSQQVKKALEQWADDAQVFGDVYVRFPDCEPRVSR